MDWREKQSERDKERFADQQSDDDKRWLQKAINDGIVDVRLGPFDDDNFPVGLFSLLRGWHDQGPPSFPTPELYADSNSRNFQESILPPATHPDVTEHWAIELGRLFVPHGSIGFMENLEQVLFDVDGNHFPTSSEYWGSPYSQFPDVSGCRWYLMIEHFDQFDGQRVNFQSATPIDPLRSLPGAPYAEKWEIDGIWYPALSPSARGMKWLIPQNRVLRFFMITPPTTLYRWVAGGRLSACTQSTYSPEAAQNARKTY